MSDSASKTSDPASKTNRAFVLLFFLLLFAIAGLLLWQFEPTSQSWHPKCAFHTWTGFHCPGCGATRAMHALLHFRWLEAVRYNPLLIVGGPIMAVLIYRQRRRERVTSVAAPRLSWALFVVLTAYFIARNVPSPTRSWLAPPAPVSVETPENASSSRSESETFQRRIASDASELAG